MLGSKILYCLILIIALQVTFSQNAFAYIDPATGSYIIQTVIAIFVGALFTIKVYWRKIKDFFNDCFFNKMKNDPRD